jgi:hypothetical protein
LNEKTIDWWGLVSEPIKSEGAKPRDDGQAKALCFSLDWRAQFERARLASNAEFRNLLVKVGVVVALALPVNLTAEMKTNLLCQLAALAGFLLLLHVIWQAADMSIRGWRADNSPFRPFCNHCGKYIPVQTVWKCGFCDAENKNTRTFSFLYKCQHCEAIPKAYRCHHCAEIIYLEADKDDKHCATALKQEPPKEPKPVSEIRREEIETKEFQLATADLDIELARKKRELEESLRRKEPESTAEQLKKSFNEGWNADVEIHSIVHQARQKVREDFPNDSEMVKRVDMYSERWMCERLGETQ